jgi:hypothetical protein
MKRVIVFIIFMLSISSSVFAQDTISQWAVSASATSEYGSDGWSATQATGEPDTDDCGDFGTAWASATSTGEDAITLFYEQAVIPTQINIYQTYNPGAISRVELFNSDTEVVLAVKKSNDKPGKTDCPGVFTLDIEATDQAVNGVILYLDQSVTGDWNEIDAVELVGVPVDAPVEDTTTSTNTGDAAGISVECPEGFAFDNGVETIVNMRSGFNYTATAIGMNGFDPIIAVMDEEGTILCNDDDANAAGYVAGLPSTGNVDASALSAQMPFSYNGNNSFGDISIIVGSVDNTPGEFVLVIEGLVVTDADNTGDAPGDPITLHLTPNMHASGIPVSAYMISVTQGLDPFLYVVDKDAQQVQLDDGSYISCDDAGTTNCWGESTELGSSYISRQNGNALAGGNLDAMMQFTWDDLGFEAGDEANIYLRLTSSNLETGGDYVAVFHMGTANSFDS